jgi:hypothetical protein
MFSHMQRAQGFAIFHKPFILLCSGTGTGGREDRETVE